MSTKVFDAYVVPTGTCQTARALFQLSHHIRRKLTPIAEKLALAAMAQQATFLVDSLSVGLNQGTSEAPLWMLLQQWEDAQRELRAGRRQVRWDFNLEWMFYRTMDGRVLIKLFGEDLMCGAFRRAFPRFRDYHYQDCTDRPSEIPEKEWSRRRQDWEQVVGEGSWCMTGLAGKIWGIYDSPFPIEDHKFIKFIPPLQRRAETIAREVALREWCEIHHPNRKELSIGSVRGFLESYNSPENLILRRELTAKLKRLLIRRITSGHLTTPGESLNPVENRITGTEQSLDGSCL